MARTRDVLKHVSHEVARRRRRCGANRTHTIHAGESCLVVTGSMANDKKSYCASCSNLILAKAESRVSGLLDALRASPAGDSASEEAGS